MVDITSVPGGDGGERGRVGSSTPTAGLARQLGERVKELDALHRCAKLLLIDHATDDDLLAAVAALLPTGFQHPTDTTAAVRLGERRYPTPGHRDARWTLRRELVTADGVVGAIDVAYHGRWPDPAEPDGLGPFLIEEVRLLESLSDMLRLALDRRRAEEAARRSRDRLELAFDAAGMGVWERDLISNEVTWSPHLARLVGFADEQRAPFGGLAHLVHPDDHPAMDAFHAGPRVDGPPRTVEFRLRRPDGGWRPVSATGRVVADAEGRPRRMVAMIMDITGRRALEAGLQQAQKLEALGQVAGGIAHDFNNLLTVVTYAASALQGQVPAGAARDLLGEIDIAAGRATALTRQLLAFSRRAEFHPAAIELDPLIARLRPLLGRIVGRDVELRTELSAGDARVWADASQLEQVVMNLVVNARDAMARGGVVTIVTRATIAAGAGDGDGDGAGPGDGDGDGDGPHARIEVRDTGAGIPADVIDRIFEPFFTTKAPGQGTGLGLAVVRAVARQWRGEVTAANLPGGGARFDVRLPLVVATPG